MSHPNHCLETEQSGAEFEEVCEIVHKMQAFCMMKGYKVAYDCVVDYQPLSYPSFHKHCPYPCRLALFALAQSSCSTSFMVLVLALTSISKLSSVFL